MGEYSFKVADYAVLSVAFPSNHIRWVKMLTLRGEPLSGHGTIEYELRINAGGHVEDKIGPGKLVLATAASTFTYRAEQNVSDTLYDHVYQVCANERPVTIEVLYDGAPAVPFKVQGTTTRKCTGFRIKTGAEPVGEGIEDIEALLRDA